MSKNNDNLAKELVNAFEEVIFFLDEHLNRDISIIQTRILLNSKMKLVSKSLNEFSIEASHSSEYKIEVYFKILELANGITYRIPNILELDKVRMEYQSLTNFLRMQLANFHQDSIIAQSYSTASILSNLLIDDIPRIDKLPEFPSIGNDPKSFIDTIIPLSNFCQSTWGIFETLISFLPVITLESLTSWVDNMMWNTRLHWDIFQSIDVIAILKTRKVKDMGKFIDNLIIFCNTQMEMTFFILDLYPKFGNKVPLNINTYNLFHDFTLKSFKDYLISTKNLIMDKIDDLNEGYRTFLMDRNDDPTKRELYEDFILFLKEFELQQNILQFYEESKQNDKDLVETIVKQNTKFMLGVIKLAGGFEKICDSFFVTSFLIITYETLPFVGQLSIIKNDPSIFENFKYEYSNILRNFTVEEDAPLYYMLNLCQLYIDSFFRKTIDFDKLYDEFEQKIDSFLLKPRLYLAISVQMILFTYLSENKTSEHRLKIIKNIEFNEILSNQIGSTVKDFRKFLNYIASYDINNYIELNLNHRLNVPLDNMSWIIPDLSYYFEKKQMMNIPYIPFNLSSDDVIDEQIDE